MTFVMYIRTYLNLENVSKMFKVKEMEYKGKQRKYQLSSKPKQYQKAFFSFTGDIFCYKIDRQIDRFITTNLDLDNNKALNVPTKDSKP